MVLAFDLENITENVTYGGPIEAYAPRTESGPALQTQYVFLTPDSDKTIGTFSKERLPNPVLRWRQELLLGRTVRTTGN